MTQAIPKLVTFEDFAAWRPEGGRYELHDGVIVEMAQPVGDHEDVVGFLVEKIAIEYVRNGLPYTIPKTALVKPTNSESAYSPDVLLLNRPNLINEPLWKKESTVSLAASIPLVVEVVSTNWDDDYYTKQGKYEGIGIPEYWVVDYLGLGAKKFTGNPKQPTISIYQLIDGEYQVTQFRGSNRIVSPTFSELNLTAEQIFQAGGLPT
ncbi:MAG: Uma2 family endonuclease [Nostoc sp. NMS1]|uniref:Uma2 family endonuclease n=1 Tax=unclassified Nostoc TaxID=2593658 RepID=UPI0025DC0A46|nr:MULTISPECIES: Uma2 family endonuclease [unclassified Nostoc]MBN3909882.1 Uma2 family endonuclease [Nostoc sp. NMS1]MBN3989338.1 Uma2 family endonuclease [Nostoc sp. NMS2]